MVILAIETSCDDTCISIINISGKKQLKIRVLSNIVSSQVEIHKKYGGVYPFLAKREHQKNLPLVFKKAMRQAKNPKVDTIAVTIGPGLEPCLYTGVNFAKDLAKKLKVNLIPVNHIEAHIYANFPKSDTELPKEAKVKKRFISSPTELPKEAKVKKRTSFSSTFFKNVFPAIALIVSGGHTQIILVKDFGKYKVLGETRDDAAGECFDKTARMLGLDYPGGPAIEKEASKIQDTRYKIQINLPRPMLNQKNYDFSFSGLKTAALYHFKSQKPKIRQSQEYIRSMAYELQQAIIDVLIYKTLKAARENKVKSIILGGGVSANKELRKQFKAKIKKDLPNTICKIPDAKYSTDNALMIALTAYYLLKNKAQRWKKTAVNANLRL